jgi:hypothetical protein
MLKRWLSPKKSRNIKYRNKNQDTMETQNNNPGDKKWNNAQSDELNEGFSGENLPDNYNPAELKPETETDETGNTKHVDRARNPDESDRNRDDKSMALGNEDIENEKSLENRDRNYDPDPNRYPASHPDNHTNRGNMDLDNE